MDSHLAGENEILIDCLVSCIYRSRPFALNIVSRRAAVVHAKNTRFPITGDTPKRPIMFFISRRETTNINQSVLGPWDTNRNHATPFRGMMYDALLCYELRHTKSLSCGLYLSRTVGRARSFQRVDFFIAFVGGCFSRKIKTIRYEKMTRSLTEKCGRNFWSSDHSATESS